MSKSTKMAPKDAARIQSAEAKQNGGAVSKGSFAAKAQKAAAKK
ncbi:MAG: hypothetical protein LBP40_02570 [Campylobacteraceae bacterium]|jgi:hypothetical protein|nr:hypothetical protein [Campylobacteraceae bacterium]